MFEATSLLETETWIHYIENSIYINMCPLDD